MSEETDVKGWLVVDDVNLDMLERQRKSLHKVLCGLQSGKLPSPKLELDLEGIANLLDHWSDQIFYRKEGKKDMPHDFVVRVSGCSREQAEQVLRERLGHDEDYGFNYTLNW